MNIKHELIVHQKDVIPLSLHTSIKLGLMKHCESAKQISDESGIYKKIFRSITEAQLKEGTFVGP